MPSCLERFLLLLLNIHKQGFSKALNPDIVFLQNTSSPIFRVYLESTVKLLLTLNQLISKRLLSYAGCVNTLPLGVANDKVIQDQQMSASSYFMKNYLIPKDGRLNAATAWCPKTKHGSDWLQVDMGALYLVCAIATQGKQSGAAEWTTSYWISMSRDGIIFEQYEESGKVKVCQLLCI